MSSYQKIYECQQCGWTLKQSKTHIKPLNNKKDFSELVGDSLSSEHSKCPDCGGKVVSTTSKEVE